MSEHSKHSDDEQGWLVPAYTFETEEAFSPRSAYTFETEEGLSPRSVENLVIQTQEEEEECNLELIKAQDIECNEQLIDVFQCTIISTLQTAVNNERVEPNVIDPDKNDVQNDTKDTEYNEKARENPSDHNRFFREQTVYDVESAMVDDDLIVMGDFSSIESLPEDTTKSTISVNSKQDTSVIQDTSMIKDDGDEADDEVDDDADSLVPVADYSLFFEEEDSDDSLFVGHLSLNSTISVNSKQDTSLIIEDDDEADSLVPADDDSLFLEEKEDSDDFLFVGYLSPNRKPKKRIEARPVEIDVDDESSDLSTNSRVEDRYQQQKNQDEDAVSLTSSYNSYLQAIESVTAWANSDVERATVMAIDKIHIKTPKDTIEEDTPDFEEEEDYERYRVSFTPSNALYLQAMEGASAKAMVDIERTTALALRKINAATSTSCKEIDNTVSNNSVTALNSNNRALGLLFFVFLFFSFSGNLERIRSISNSSEIDSFQILQRTGYSDLSMWEEKQIVINIKPTNIEVSKKDRKADNVDRAFKLSLLAAGWI